ncbi:hypothetical protein ACLOJK_033589 [Asimina triloba]
MEVIGMRDASSNGLKKINLMCYLQHEKFGTEESSREIFSFIVKTLEAAIKVWHETSKVDARVNFLLDEQKTQTDKYAPIVNIDKYAEDSFSRAACLVVSKSVISYPQQVIYESVKPVKLDERKECMPSTNIIYDWSSRLEGTIVGISAIANADAIYEIFIQGKLLLWHYVAFLPLQMQLS